MVDRNEVAVGFEDRLRAREARVAVIGMGYVGLPLACEFARAGLTVTGIDVDVDRIDEINRGDSYIGDVSSKELKEVVDAGRLHASLPGPILGEADAISICVPTPLRKSKDPDISYIVSATEVVAENLRRGQLVVLESTTYPGTTEEVILPRLEATGLEVGKDFFLAFSPERVDPGNEKYTTRNTPKVVGGVTSLCVEMAKSLYELAVDTVVPVSSPGAAEMVKLLENTFRSVNIGLVNELAIICDKLGVDVWEVIGAAATKPFGFMPFWPGPGLGGHCIPIDPHYLSWKLKTLNYHARFIELADSVNTAMPAHVVDRVADALNGVQKAVNGSHVVVLGVAYKRDVSDCRESPAQDVIELLRRRGAEVSFVDPYVDRYVVAGEPVRRLEFGASALKESDCVVVVTDHSDFDAAAVVEAAPLVVDTRNLTRDHADLPHVRRL